MISPGVPCCRVHAGDTIDGKSELRRRGRTPTMRRWQKLAFAVMAWTAAIGAAGIATAQTKPQGEMRVAVYVTLPPAWLDAGEAPPGFPTPFWVLYALHDALVKP